MLITAVQCELCGQLAGISKLYLPMGEYPLPSGWQMIERPDGDKHICGHCYKDILENAGVLDLVYLDTVRLDELPTE